MPFVSDLVEVYVFSNLLHFHSGNAKSKKFQRSIVPSGERIILNSMENENTIAMQMQFLTTYRQTPTEPFPGQISFLLCWLDWRIPLKFWLNRDIVGPKHWEKYRRKLPSRAPLLSNIYPPVQIDHHSAETINQTLHVRASQYVQGAEETTA